MKNSPYSERLEQLLRGSKITAGGFYGSDTRDVSDIIDSDAEVIEKFGITCDEIALRMNAVTERAAEALGGWAKIYDKKQARIDEAKGSIICPWPHPGRYAKRITILQCQDTEILWSDLSIHLIAAHGFFEGRGAAFRIEPEELINMLW